MCVCVKKLKQEIRRAKLTTRKPRKALPKWNEMSCHYGLRWRVNSKQHFARLPLSSLFVVVGCYICCSYAVPIFSLFSFCCFFLLLYSFFFNYILILSLPALMHTKDCLLSCQREFMQIKLWYCPNATALTTHLNCKSAPSSRRW